ncbi:MAG TPA: hypothetical protein VLF09_07860 [Cellvibrio sp.]|nr:hypothetical protein [Cellvibrio sp.]
MHNMSGIITDSVLGAIINHPAQPAIKKCAFGGVAQRCYLINNGQYANIKYCNYPIKQGWYQFKFTASSIAKLKELDAESKCSVVFVLTNIDDACVVPVRDLLVILSARYDATGYEKVVPIMVNPTANGFEIFANQGHCKNKKVGLMTVPASKFPKALFTA